MASALNKEHVNNTGFTLVMLYNQCNCQMLRVISMILYLKDFAKKLWWCIKISCNASRTSAMELQCLTLHRPFTDKWLTTVLHLRKEKMFLLLLYSVLGMMHIITTGLKLEVISRPAP